MKPKPAPDQPEQSMGPMAADGCATETNNQALQQTRVFSFFSNKQLERLQISFVKRQPPMRASTPLLQF
jgi:hypothetical protein